MMKLSHIVSAISTGMERGAQPLIRYCYGHGDYERIKRIIQFPIIQGLIIGAVVWLLCTVFARQLLSLFGSGDALCMEFGTVIIRTCLGLVFLNSLQIMTSNILMAIGKAYKGALLTIARNLILCAFSGLLLCPGTGIQGVLVEGLIADAGSAILSALLLLSESRALSAKIEAAQT